MYTYIILDGNKYPVVAGSYMRRWIRAFTSYLAANIVRLNFVDKGPGVKTYQFQVHIVQWDPDSEPYLAGITQDAITQMTNLETTYAKIATPVQFTDPFGSNNPDGVVVTDFQQHIPEQSTPEKIYMMATLELSELTPGTVNP